MVVTTSIAFINSLATQVTLKKKTGINLRFTDFTDFHNRGNSILQRPPNLTYTMK